MLMARTMIIVMGAALLLFTASVAFAQQMSRDEIISVQMGLDDAGFSPGQGSTGNGAR